MLHDNAHPHTAVHTLETLQKLNFEVMAHPPYIPDLASSDFHLCSYSDTLRFCRFTSDETVNEFLGSQLNLILILRGFQEAWTTMDQLLRKGKGRMLKEMYNLSEANHLLSDYLSNRPLISPSLLLRGPYGGHRFAVGPRPEHLKSSQPVCIACGSNSLSLAHRYWSCSAVRPVIREVLSIIGRPPDLQSWIQLISSTTPSPFPQ
ncbi:hypothetical protein LAZ67_1007227 [Cordylochernes scorpioides]|uniref:Transposase n=1 Tax=Cordylochernes scorpioides TaxID=51811 RepID=A0ABY6K0P4_9ARAC|nr:hypothetical protein LAZ67_1007227 [Cordylochernes scorpioides]